MFCEKCGNQINDGDLFCQKCGAPVPGQTPVQAAEQTAEQVQYVQQAASQAPEQAPQQAQQFAPAPEQAQQYAPAPDQAQQFAPAPAPKAPRKPLSPKMKKIIIFGGAGVAVLAAFLIVLFTVIIPAAREASRIDITKYYTIKIDGVDKEEENPSVLDGKIDGSFGIDYKKFAEENKVDEEKAEDYLGKLSSMLNVKVTKDGKKASDYLDDVKAEDVYTITVEWPTDGGSAEMDAISERLNDYGFGSLSDSIDPEKKIEKIENELGVEFKHKSLSCDIKVADALDAQGIKLAVPTEMNVLGYIKDNNLFVQDGHRSGDISLSIKKFETTFGDFTVSKPDDEYYTNVTVKKGNKEVGSFDIEMSNHNYLKSNEEITVSYDSYDVSSLADKGVVLTGDQITYTVVGPEEFTADVAKNNVEALKTFFNDNVKKEDWKADEKDQITLNNIYYSTNSDDRAYIVYVYTNTTQKYSKTMYMDAKYLYMEGGALKNDAYCYTGSSGKDVKEAVSNCSYLKSPYTSTQRL